MRSSSYLVAPASSILLLLLGILHEHTVLASPVERASRAGKPLWEFSRFHDEKDEGMEFFRIETRGRLYDLMNLIAPIEEARTDVYEIIYHPHDVFKVQLFYVSLQVSKYHAKERTRLTLL